MPLIRKVENSGRWSSTLASDRRSFPIALLLVIIFSFYWYGAFLSFPVFGPDAGSPFYVLLAAIKDRHFATLGYPMNWSEGLGQENPFLTFTFDPFAWVIPLLSDPGDGYRLSMALRAISAWASCYWFVIVLFRGRRAIALPAATLYLLVSFVLTSAWGTYVWAGVYVATHAALFPLLAALVLLIMRNPRWFGISDVAFFVVLLFFLLDYPIGSLLGTSVLLAFAGVALLSSRPTERPAAVVGFAKILAMVAIPLLLPPLEAFSSWSAVMRDSARVVFAKELYAYGNSHRPPLLWADTPLALRLIVLVCLAALLFSRRWPRPLRLVAGVLLLVVGGVQLGAVAKFLGLDGGLVDHLPRLHYFEFYTPLFYATAGGFALYYWRDLLFPRLDDRRQVLAWLSRAATFLLLALFIQPVVAAVAGGARAIVARGRALGVWPDPRSAVSPTLNRLVARGGLLALVALAVASWLPPTATIYPIFFAYLRCQSGLIWCRDEMGRTVGAGSNPVTRYLRHALNDGAHFVGRAETLVRPPVRFGLLADDKMQWTEELFARLHGWYERAYDGQALKGISDSDLLRRPPGTLSWNDRQYLLSALAKLVHYDLPYYGSFPEALILEIRSWILGEGGHFGLAVTPIEDPWEGVNSIQAVTEEGSAAFFATGNGLVERSLPFQGVPIASSYEQALGYLYYLFWTRYVSAGEAAVKSINITDLEAIHPDRLALAGVRYVVARDSEVYEAPALERVMGWHGYSVYAVSDANVAGYGMSTVAFGETLSQQLRLMRTHGFQPRRTAVVSTSERPAFGDRGVEGLSTLSRASISLAPDELIFSAASSAGLSFAVLPFNWSECWKAEWRKGAGKVMRADVDLIGVAFTGAIELHLRWTAGYGASRRCLGGDEALINQAEQAAAEIDFAEAYEPFGPTAAPFAASRPRFAADMIDARKLEREAIYSSGDEVVVPARFAALLSDNELHGHGWTPEVSPALRAKGDGYELAARSAGGASLVVLPLRHSYCWVAEWQGREGALVPVDSRWLGVLFHDSTSVELRLPPAGASPTCEPEDRAQRTVEEFLARGGGATGIERYTLGDAIVFRSGGNGEAFTNQDWSQPESWGRWSLGPVARLVLRIAPPASGDLELVATVNALLGGTQRHVRATVSVNGVNIDTWEFRPEATSDPRRAVVPRALVVDTGIMIVDFSVDDPLSPAELGMSGDTRKLGLAFQRLAVGAAAAK